MPLSCENRIELILANPSKHCILGVIILTNYRSGSTFLGELFNQHSNAFYIFEPLFPITRKCNRFSDLKTQVLHQYLKCDFPRFTDIFQIEELPGRSDFTRRECLINDFCFRYVVEKHCMKSNNLSTYHEAARI